jgi:hypothetical protein
MRPEGLLIDTGRYETINTIPQAESLSSNAAKHQTTERMNQAGRKLYPAFCVLERM